MEHKNETDSQDKSQDTTPQEKNEFMLALERMGAAKDIGSKQSAVFKSAVSSILKLLENIRKRPGQHVLRKLRMQHPVVSKYVVGMEGGLDLFKAIGFTVDSNQKGHEYLLLSDEAMALPETVERLSSAIKALNDQLEERKGNSKAIEEDKLKPKQRCKGGCGYWGQEKTEYYCSICHEKQFLGIKSKDKPVESAPDTGPPIKCTANCGFFGQRKLEGLCSKCFAAKRKKELPKKRLRIGLMKLRAVCRLKAGCKRVEQENKNRCWKCRRKVGIAGIECRCGYVYCATHRYADQHDCSFDHRKRHQANLRKANQIIKADKFDKIHEDKK